MSKELKHPLGNIALEFNQSYSDNSQHSSSDQLSCGPLSESFNNETSNANIGQLNNQSSNCLINERANGRKEKRFQNIMHSSFKQPNSYPIDEIPNGNRSVENKEKYFQYSANSSSNQLIAFPITESDNMEISPVHEALHLHNSILSYNDQSGSCPISESVNRSKESLQLQDFMHSSTEQPSSYPISKIVNSSSSKENREKYFQSSLSSSNQLISFPITESDNSGRTPLHKRNHDSSLSSNEQQCSYPIKSNSNVSKYSGSSGMHFDNTIPSSVDQPSSYPISESANGHSTDSGVGREQKSTDDTGKGISVGKAKIEDTHESLCAIPPVIGRQKTETTLIEPEITTKSKSVEILLCTKLSGTFPIEMKNNEIVDMSLKQSKHRPRSISLGSADIPVSEEIKEKFSSLPNFKTENQETSKKLKDFNTIRKSNQEETVLRLSEVSSWSKEFADLESKLSDPQLITALRTWYKESHHKIRLLYLFTSTVKNLLLEYFQNLNIKEDTPEAILIHLQNCLSYYHKEVDSLRNEVKEVKTELEENHFMNAARYQSISEEHKIRLSQVIQDHEQQLSAAMDRALNARRQAASLQVQLTSAIARNQHLEERNQQTNQSSVSDNQNMLDNLKKERDGLKIMVKDLEESLAKQKKKVKQLEDRNSSLQDQTHNGLILEKDYMNQLERQLSSERALISTLKTELQQEHNRNQQLWAETKKHVQKSAVLQSRLEAAYCEVMHKNKLLETLKEEILQKVNGAFPGVLTSAPQLTDSNISVSNWVTTMKQAINTKEQEIQTMSKELAHLEKNFFDLNSALKGKETVISNLTGEIQLAESKIISKNEEFQLKREHMNKIPVYIKNIEETILSLQQKAVEKEKILQVLQEELKRKDERLTKTVSKVKIERDKYREILASVKTSEEELKMQNRKLKQMKLEEENLKGQCLLKENNIEYLTKVLESKRKIINQMEKDIVESNTIIKGLIQNSDNLEFSPNWQNRIDENNIKQIKHSLSAETKYKALDNKTLSEIRTPEHMPERVSLDDGVKFEQMEETKNYSRNKKHKTSPMKLTSVTQDSLFSKFEIGSSIKMKSPSDSGSVYYSQSTDIGSYTPKGTSDKSSTPTPLKLKHHTDVKVTSTPLTNTRASELGPNRRLSKAKKKLMYSDGKPEKMSTGKGPTSNKIQSISLEPVGDIPIAISDNLGSSNYNLSSSHSMKKTMILHNAEGRASPVMVNVNIQPQPLLVTDSGEHFICDVAMDVYPLKKLQEQQQSKNTVSSASKEMQHGFNLEGTSEPFLLSDTEHGTASSKEKKDYSYYPENYRLQSQDHIKAFKKPENVHMLQSSGTYIVLTSKDNISKEYDISSNKLVQQRHSVPILKNPDETIIASAQVSTQTPPFTFCTSPTKPLSCNRDQSAVGRIFTSPNDITHQQKHLSSSHALKEPVFENTKEQVPQHDKFNHQLSQEKIPALTYKDFRHHHGLFWNKTFSPETFSCPKETWRIERHAFPMEKSSCNNSSNSCNSPPDYQSERTSAMLSFQPTLGKEDYIKNSSLCHIQRQVPESNVRLPVEGGENIDLYQIQ